VCQISQSRHVINNSVGLSETVSILNNDPTHLPKIFQTRKKVFCLFLTFFFQKSRLKNIERNETAGVGKATSIL